MGKDKRKGKGQGEQGQGLGKGQGTGKGRGKGRGKSRSRVSVCQEVEEVPRQGKGMLLGVAVQPPSPPPGEWQQVFMGGSGLEGGHPSLPPSSTGSTGSVAGSHQIESPSKV